MSATDSPKPRPAGLDLDSVRQSLEMLRLVIDHTPQHIFWKDKESVYLGCNAPFARVAGLSDPAEIVGKTDHELAWTSEEADFFRECDRRVMENDCPEYHIIEPQHQADGTHAWLDTTKIPLHDEDGSVVGILGMYEDITDHLRAQHELELEKKRLSHLFENSPHAILLCDGEDRIVTTNRAFQELFGFAPGELSGRRVNDVIAPEGHHDEASELSHRTMDGETVMSETVRRRRDGSLVPVQIIGIPVLIDGQPEAIYGIYVDLTERQRAEQALRESEERFRSLAEQSLQGIFVLSRRSMVFANPMLATITGHPVDVLESMSLRQVVEMVHPRDRGFVRQSLREALGPASERGSRVEYRIVNRQGETRWVLQQARSLRFEGRPALVCVVLDITEHRTAEEQLLRAALYDNLTGLPNRALFRDRVEMALERSGRHDGQAFAVLMLDLDRFKVVNDSLGHDRGDQLLVEIAARLRKLVRPGDTVARLGGDEFTVLIQTVNGAQDATAVAERIRDHLTRPVPIEGQEVVATASIGIALGGSGYHGADDVLRDADIAMNRAKKLGRDRHEIFDPSMHRHAVALLKLENDLRRAVERDELVLHYQPILDLSSWKAVAVEALVRWHHPERGLLPPAEFLPVAEETGLITNIGEWALRVACRQAAAWRQESGQPTPAISINLVSTQFTRPELVDFIKELLETNGVTADCLQLEITEETIIDAPERAVEVVARLKALGIKVHLDDFGTGYSSLSYLQRFDVDSLKIDRSFVGRMTSDASSGELVEAIVTLAHALGMQALAEGIETPEQLLRLQQLGCEMGQGFYFSPPVDPEHIRTVLEAPRGRVN